MYISTGVVCKLYKPLVDLFDSSVGKVVCICVIQGDLFIKDTLGRCGIFFHCREVVHSSEVKNALEL